MSKVILGDCVEISKKVSDDSVDFVLTDPPFNVKYHGKWDIGNYQDDLKDHEYQEWCIEWLKETNRVLKDRHFAFIFTGDKKLHYILNAVYNSGLNYLHLFKWIKRNGNGFCFGTSLFNLVECALVVSKGKPSKKLIHFKKLAHDSIFCPNIAYNSKKATGHPAQRPIELYKQIIEGFTNEKEIVYDFFMGSGTTALACIEANRQYFGSEIDPTYYELINKRIDEKNKEIKENKTTLN